MTAVTKRASLGQFMTPPSIAKFMASLFSSTGREECRVLDPGFGEGSLTTAFCDRWSPCFRHIRITGYEIDEAFYRCANVAFRDANIANGDFIDAAARLILSPEITTFTHAIINPPYRKINTGSRHRFLLRKAGIETVNAYAAFVALSVALLEEGGQLVAIIPRSWCNGLYYRPFRQFIFERAALRRIHLFHARDRAFEGVLQENVVVRLDRGTKQGTVTVSSSTDDTFGDYMEHTVPFSVIVAPDDPEFFVHIPDSPAVDRITASSAIGSSLEDLGIQVSTGPVVDFRVREYIRNLPEPGTVPLIYSCHMGGEWPKPSRKPNAIHRNAETERWLYPNGTYVITKRFSSKEERRRLVATIVKPSMFPEGTEALGFENHLNVFHTSKNGLPYHVAAGLAVYLNSTAVDDHFRRFSGHTQVNATDLRNIRYPGRESLVFLGRWAADCGNLTQEAIDRRIEELIEQSPAHNRCSSSAGLFGLSPSSTK